MTSGSSSALPQTLSETTLATGVEHVAAVDPDLAEIVARLGPPPLWAREPGFATLVHIILEQQVSLASARAVFDRLLAATDPLTPEGFLQLSDETLRAMGFSRQKTTYCRHLATSIIAGNLDLDALASMSDNVAHTQLVQLKGIGPWTASVYLLMVLRRPDILPTGDLALISAMQEVKRLEKRPSVEEMEAIAEPWRPWRAVGARLLWHHYLNR